MSESRTPAHRPASSASRAPADGPADAHDARVGRLGTGADAYEGGPRTADHRPPAPAPAVRRPADRRVRPSGGPLAPARPPHRAEAVGAGRIPATAYATACATPPPVFRGRDEVAVFRDRLRPLAPGLLPRSPWRPRTGAGPFVPRRGAVAATY